MKKNFMSKKNIITFLLMIFCICFSFAKVNPETKIKNSDWKDKALGESERPAWIMQLIWGNDSVFRKEYDIPSDKVVKIGQGRASSFMSAKLQSELNVSAAITNELKSELLSSLSDASVSDENIAIIDKIATSTTVSLTGMKEETFFWWKTLEKDPVDKKYKTRYLYVTVYTIPEKNWNKAVSNYLTEIDRKVSETFAQNIPENVEEKVLDEFDLDLTVEVEDILEN